MINRRSLSSRVRLAGLTGIAVALAAACSPVGDGTGPVRLGINGPTGTADATSARIFECIRSRVSASLYFSNGQVGDFTSRVHWSSSNPAVVRVSNGDEPVPAPGTGFYAFGALTPVAPGTATVRADYQGFSDTITVSVGTPTNIMVHTVDPQTGLPTDPAGNAFRIGVGTSADLLVTAVLDGVPSNVDASATWSFDTPNDAVATINPTSGLILGVAAGGPLTATAKFAPCSLTASTSVSVSPVTALSVVPEFGTDPLYLGNTERFRVLADFGNGPEQDLSTQVRLTSSDTTVAQFNGSLLLSNLLVPLAAGTTNVTATYTTGTGTSATTVTSPPVQATIVADTLSSIAINSTPSPATVIAGSSEIAQFHVIGTYAGGGTQDVTRQVTWTTSDSTIATIVSGGAQAGQAISTGTTPGTATFTGTISTTTPPLTATTTLTTTAPPP